MGMERIALLGSTLFYLFGFGHTLYALGAGRFQPGRFNVAAVALGACAQGWYLAMVGAASHACPIRTLSEMLIFLGWSIALIYLLVGPAYRLSLMGAFTAPLVLLLQLVAIVLPGESRHLIPPANSWVEMHAAVSLVAFGALGLACVSGIMFLVQEAQLKSRRPTTIFHHLPPISVLLQAVQRLLWTGFLLLTFSFVAGWQARLSIAGAKYWFSLLIWFLYAFLLIGSTMGRINGRRRAQGAAFTFLLALVLLPVIRYFSVITNH